MKLHKQFAIVCELFMNVLHNVSTLYMKLKCVTK